MPVLEPNFRCFTRTLSKLRGGYPKLLAEDLPQLVRNQTVVYSYGTNLSAAAT
jgi:hypothetical protein